MASWCALLLAVATSDFAESQLVLAEEVEKMTLKYPGGQAHDAESLLIDHQARTLLLITKSLTECRVFTAPLDFFPGNALHTL